MNDVDVDNISFLINPALYKTNGKNILIALGDFLKRPLSRHDLYKTD